MDFTQFMNLSQKSYDSFQREYGERKVRKIQNTLNKSKHTASLLKQSRDNFIVPTASDFASCVLSNLSMSFSSKPTVRFAAQLLLDKWNWEINQEYYLAPESKVIQIFNDIQNNIN